MLCCILSCSTLRGSHLFRSQPTYHQTRSFFLLLSSLFPRSHVLRPPNGIYVYGSSFALSLVSFVAMPSIPRLILRALSLSLSLSFSLSPSICMPVLCIFGHVHLCEVRRCGFMCTSLRSERVKVRENIGREDERGCFKWVNTSPRRSCQILLGHWNDGDDPALLFLRLPSSSTDRASKRRFIGRM